MGLSIGELFVSLGFDVDDEKLKAFSDSIRDTERTLAKIVGTATAGVVAIGAFIATPLERASQFKQFTDQLGYSSEEMQKWARVASLLNHSISFDQALGKYQAFAEYVQKIPTGQTGGELAALVQDFQANMKPEQYLEALSDSARSGMWVQRFGENWRSFVIPQLQSMGLGGDFIDALMSSAADRDRMTKGLVMSDEDRQKLEDINQKVADIKAQYERFAQDMTIKYAPSILAFLTSFSRELDKLLPQIQKVADDLGGWKRIGEYILLYFAGTWAVGMAATFIKVTKAALGASAAIGRGFGLAMGASATAPQLLVGGAALGAGIYGANALNEHTGWAQAFADTFFPVKQGDWSKTYPKNQPAQVTQSVGIYINSSAPPDQIAQEVVGHIENQKQKAVKKSYGQTDLGAVQ